MPLIWKFEGNLSLASFEGIFLKQIKTGSSQTPQSSLMFESGTLAVCFTARTLCDCRCNRLQRIFLRFATTRHSWPVGKGVVGGRCCAFWRRDDDDDDDDDDAAAADDDDDDDNDDEEKQEEDFEDQVEDADEDDR